MRIENDLRILAGSLKYEKPEQIRRPGNDQQSDKESQKDVNLALLEPVDQFIASEQVSNMPPKGYGYSQFGEPTIEKLKFTSKEPPNDLRNLVRRLLESQGLIFKDLAGMEGIFILDEKARTEAALALSDAGPLGIQVLAENIAAYAKASCAADKGQLTQLQSAIEQGFADAGQLPLICHKTKNLALQLLGDWAKS